MFQLKQSKVRAIGYTRYISIPKAWLENMGITTGDQVKIFLNKDGNIEVVPARTFERYNERTIGKFELFLGLLVWLRRSLFLILQLYSIIPRQYFF